MSKVETTIEEGRVIINVDSNEDGESSILAKVTLGEAAKEIIKRGDSIEGEAMVKFKMGPRGIELSLDTDQDGVPSLEIEINLLETFDEAKDKF